MSVTSRISLFFCKKYVMYYPIISAPIKKGLIFIFKFYNKFYADALFSFLYIET